MTTPPTTLLPRRTPGTDSLPVTVTARPVGDAVVLCCAGDLDVAAVAPMADAVRRALADHPAALVLDLDGVEFCDTVGLRVLLSAAGRARNQGCLLALAALRPPVADLLVRVCADRALPSYADAGAALDALTAARAWR
jgi:anti-anti-sigma factor